MESQKNLRLVLIILGVFALVNAFAWGLFFYTMNNQNIQRTQSQQTINQNIMKIQSSAFENNGTLSSAFTCDGENVNPDLQISEVMENAKSLALIVNDPDAPSGDWVHWIVWNIDPKITEIKQNSTPSNGVLGQTDFGENKWNGPCPPSGIHHYNFTLYALDIMLDIPTSSKKAELLKAMEGHIVDQTVLVGMYQRKK